MKAGQQVAHRSEVTDGGNLGTVAAVRPDGSVRVVWRRPDRHAPRLRVWYDAATARSFLEAR